MTQYKKKVFIEKHTLKEFNKLEICIKEELFALFKELSLFGFLEYPEGKKLQGYDLYEGRVKNIGIFRCIYSYEKENVILVLNVFRKKTNKTPIKEIEKALKKED